MELLYVSVIVASNGPIEVWAKLVPSWTKLIDAVVIAMVTTSGLVMNELVMNELVTMVVDNLVMLLLEQVAKDGSDKN